MRKYIRKMLRSKAERMRVKPSRFVGSEFDKIQVKKYGSTRRKLNQVKGTHKRSTWRQRVSLYV